MAKKNFKKGLGSLIQDTRNKNNETHKDENAKDSDFDEEKIKQTEAKLSLYENELWLWRTGRITLDNFDETLREKGLFYNALLNSFEKINVDHT